MLPGLIHRPALANWVIKHRRLLKKRKEIRSNVRSALRFILFSFVYNYSLTATVKFYRADRPG